MEFWIGLLLSIPIAIATNLATPRIQKWLEVSSKKRAVEKTKDLQEEYQRILVYVNNPDEFTSYLLFVVIRTTLIGSVVGIISGLAYVAGQLSSSLFYVYEISGFIYAAAQIISIIGALMIVNICRTAASTWYKVKNFDRYQQTVRESEAKLANQLINQ